MPKLSRVCNFPQPVPVCAPTAAAPEAGACVRNVVVRAVLLTAAVAPLALAHEGEPIEPHDLWTAWSFEPGIVIPLVLSALLYWRGTSGRPGRRFEKTAFWAGWTVMAVALVSPLHPLGEALFSAHMAQHVLLMTVAAPLMVLGRPLGPFLRALPVSWRRAAADTGNASWFQRCWHAISSPAAATTIQAVALWVWHAPPLYQATLTSEFVHALQHLSFVFSALLFWWALTHGRTGRVAYGASFLYVFITATHSGILGALLTFAQVALYPAYSGRTGAWGLTPLEDQQLGGLIIWVPGGTIYIAAGLLFVAGWLKEAELRARRREARTGAISGEV